jgi:hypothetical protein
MKPATMARALASAFVLSLSLVLVGCGGGGGGGGTPATHDMVIMPALGKYLSGTVTIYNLDGTAVSGATGSIVPATGAVKINVGTNTGPFIVEVKGGSYWDEATQSVVTLTNTDVMRALVPSVSAASTDISVNALTNAAAERLKDATKPGFQVASGTTATGIQQANLTVATLMGLPGVDIVNVIPTALDGTTKIVGTTSADLLAIKLAALSQVALNGGTTAMVVATRLASELKDDGQLNGSGETGLTAAAINTATQTVAGNSNLVDSGNQVALHNVVVASENQAEQQLTTEQQASIAGAQVPNSDITQAKQFFANLRTGILPYTNNDNTGFLDQEEDKIETEFNQITTASISGIKDTRKIAGWAKDLHDGKSPSGCYSYNPVNQADTTHVGCQYFSNNGQNWVGVIMSKDGTTWAIY